MKGTHLHEEIDQALVCHIERPENAARLLQVRDQLDALCDRTSQHPLLSPGVLEGTAVGATNQCDSGAHDAD